MSSRYTAECVCVCARTRMLCCMLHALRLSYAANLGVCVAAYIQKSLNHGSCHFCSICQSMLSAPHTAVSVCRQSSDCVCVCVCGQAQPDEVTDKSRPFGNPPLAPSSRSSINYSHSISRTSWCMDVGLLPSPLPEWRFPFLFQNVQLMPPVLSSLLLSDNILFNLWRSYNSSKFVDSSVSMLCLVDKHPLWIGEKISHSHFNPHQNHKIQRIY